MFSVRIMIIALLLGTSLAGAANNPARGLCPDDIDGDGFDSTYCGGADCDDTDASVYPGAIEICGDGIDQNCDGIGASSTDDEDLDGCSNAQENTLLTDICDADTDNDNITDGDEVGGNCTVDANETSPRDADSDDDGIPDGAESRTNDTDMDGLPDALDRDRDGDLLPDGLEVGLTSGIPGGTSEGVGVLFQGSSNFTPDSDPTTTTNPNTPDTDGDGLLDGQEDFNLNGAVDAMESDPNDSDSDDDGLDDGAEDLNKNGILDLQETSPTNPDSDGDGICDGDRVDNDGDGINPTDPCNSSENTEGTDALDADTDDDGLSDGEELGLGLDPTNPDSDNDQLSDGLERGVVSGLPIVGVIAGTAASWIADNDPSTTTDPLNPDTDGDQLPDGTEDANMNGAVNNGETDPNVADTDSDGINDFEEQLCGSDPLDPLSASDCLIVSDSFE